jgi:hypothetical protein
VISSSVPNGLPKDDVWSIAAIGLLAMCLVTIDHEALGHGGMCLALGGHILELTSSIFRCDLHSRWIAPAGPFANLAMGTTALLVLRFTASRSVRARLFLILVAALSYFWEAGYAIHAMHLRDGDMYFAGQDFLGEPSLGWRIAGAALGLALFVFTARWVWRAMLELWVGDLTLARRAARILWVSATLGAVGAALGYRGAGFSDLRDAALEIGASAFPLLWMPSRGAVQRNAHAEIIGRDTRLIAAALLIYTVFVATLGRGLFA